MVASPVREYRASELLRAKIELFGGRMNQAAYRFWTHSRFEWAYQEYILQFYFLIRTNVSLMQAAEQACRSGRHASDPALQSFGDYLRRHIPEEMGHDEWLLDDGAAMGIERAAVLNRLPKPAVTDLVGAQYNWIHHHSPIALAGYMAVLEGGSRSVESYQEIIRAHHLPPEAFTTLLRHARLDPHHSQDLDDLLDSLPLSKDQLGLIGLSAIRTMNYIAGILEGIVLEGGLPPARGSSLAPPAGLKSRAD